MTRLPTADEAELALLGAIVIDQTTLASVTEICSGADFADSDLGELYDALYAIDAAGRPLHDAAILVSELRRLRIADSVRSPAFLAKLLADGQVQAGHATHYAHQVKRASTLRRLALLSKQLATRAADPAADPATIAQWVEGQLIGVGDHSGDGPRSVGDVAADVVADLRKPRPGGGIASGLLAHDIVAGGWQPGELIVLAARPGVGKTAFAAQVAQHNAERGRNVLFVSLEMTAAELVGRLLCGIGGVDSRRLRAAGLDQASLQAVASASTEVAGLPFRIWAPAAATLAKIRGMARRDAAGPGLQLLIVDYLGLVKTTDPKRPRWEQIGEISRELKCLAKELAVPILALAQLNREADGIEPRLSHLRDSGSIEQDADVVLFLHRDDQEKDKAKLIIAKHRHGQTGRINVTWDASRTRYTDNSFPSDGF